MAGPVWRPEESRPGPGGAGRWTLRWAPARGAPWWDRGTRGKALRAPPPLPVVSSLEKTLPQLLAKLNLLENRGVRNASLALSASISRVRELIAQARGAANRVSQSIRAAGCLALCAGR